ncbi:MAG: AAA family ATPase [Nitrosopumilaceae archaeon]|nr:AAA family ATPase [Nitrosopumilaceae archaeon]NIU01408.1 AAA family ATPase [Nitrosopumilaceae archaeon]NIU87766.1 AAA family ATPase [Nitrosopumilaceae archaeon]NIV66144.1 AAA family ATPase [Nitrosopumilaceae archaeon]NIX62010.1 AAA family ATPase [Nitrosopumilaceae archaeon]
MDTRTLEGIIQEAEEEDRLFANKAALETNSQLAPKKLVGRDRETKRLVKMLIGFKKGYSPPLISVYGKSGAGKSTIVKFVCESMQNQGIKPFIVNLRKARTVFGATRIILAEFGKPDIKSPQGMSLALDKIKEAIMSTLQRKDKRYLVLVLDEFDAIFSDKRGKPSDFVYKLLEMQSELKRDGFLMSVITISNNVLSEYGLEERVKSRIGSDEVLFSPYSKDDVLEILRSKSRDAFVSKVDSSVLDYCAEKSAIEHGDARRAINLLRVGGELASSEGKSISKRHIERAEKILQKDRVEEFVGTSSYHVRLISLCLAILTFWHEREWFRTKEIYDSYKKLMEKEVKPLEYRRFSDLLSELEDNGIAESKKSSKGRGGYFAEYRLSVLPETIAKATAEDYWNEHVVKEKESMQSVLKNADRIKKSDTFYPLYEKYLEEYENRWK